MCRSICADLCARVLDLFCGEWEDMIKLDFTLTDRAEHQVGERLGSADGQKIKLNK